MSNPKALKSWDQKDLFNEIHKILKRKFGKVPKRGVVAGQAVASAVFEVVGLGVEGPYKDLDLFIERYELDKLQDTLMSKMMVGKKERELLRQLRTPKVIEKQGVSTTAGKLQFVTKTSDIGEYEEDLINRLEVDSSSYRIQRVFEPRDDYPLNIVEVSINKSNGVSDIEAIVAGFDFNLTQVGVDLSKKEVFWTQEFEQFLFRPELKVSNFKTPVGSALRLMEKLEAMPWLECDVDDNLAKLRDARWIANEYEKKFVLRENLGPDDDDDYWKQKKDHKWTVGDKQYSLTAFTEKKDPQYGNVKIFKLASGDNKKTRRMPGVRLSESRAARWLKFEDKLSKHFEVSGSPKTIIEKTCLDGGRNETKSGPGYFDGKKVVHESEYKVYECMPRYDSKLENAWQNVFGKDLFNKRHFFNVMAHDFVNGRLGGMERVFSDMNWVNRMARSEDKEAKARVALIKEVIVPKLTEELTRIEKLDNEGMSGKDLDRELSSDDLIVPMILARLLVSRENDMKFTGLQPKTFQRYMRACIDEQMMLTAITESSQNREKMFKNFSFLKKSGELGIFAAPLISRRDLSLKDLLLTDKKELKQIIEVEDAILAKMGVEPMFKPAKLKNGFVVKELCNHRDLKNRGRTEKHCVSGYMGPVEQGSCIILQIDNKEDRSRSTAEITLSMEEGEDGIRVKVAQHRAKQNSIAPSANERILESWVNSFQEAIDLARKGKQDQIHDYWKTALASVRLNGEINRISLETGERVDRDLPHDAPYLSEIQQNKRWDRGFEVA